MAFVIPRGAFVHGIVVWLAVSDSVMASGTLPVLPVTETLPDFAACLARLEGVVKIGPQAARYEATLWFHAGRADPARKQVETSHTFETRLHTCTGGLLTTEGTDGYTLSTFDPLP